MAVLDLDFSKSISPVKGKIYSLYTSYKKVSELVYHWEVISDKSQDFFNQVDYRKNQILQDSDFPIETVKEEAGCFAFFEVFNIQYCRTVREHLNVLKSKLDNLQKDIENLIPEGMFIKLEENYFYGCQEVDQDSGLADDEPEESGKAK